MPADCASRQNSGSLVAVSRRRQRWTSRRDSDLSLDTAPGSARVRIGCLRWVGGQASQGGSWDREAPRRRAHGPAVQPAGGRSVAWICGRLRNVEGVRRTASHIEAPDDQGRDLPKNLEAPGVRRRGAPVLTARWPPGRIRPRSCEAFWRRGGGRWSGRSAGWVVSGERHQPSPAPCRCSPVPAGREPGAAVR